MAARCLVEDEEGAEEGAEASTPMAQPPVEAASAAEARAPVQGDSALPARALQASKHWVEEQRPTRATSVASACVSGSVSAWWPAAAPAAWPSRRRRRAPIT